MSIQNINANLNRIVTDLQQKVTRTVEDITLDLLSKSIPLTPVYTGDLRGSAKQIVRVNTNRIIGEVKFNMPYAERIHEDLSIRHPIHTWNGVQYDCSGGAKYLERPFVQNTSRYIQSIERAVEEAVR